MQIPILVEPVDHNGYRARCGDPLSLSAEGATSDEAVSRLRALIANRLALGAVVIPLEIPAVENPWNRVVGMYKDDPLFDEWQQAIAERRRQLDADPDVP